MSLPEIKVTGRVLTLSQSTLKRNPNLAGGAESQRRVLAAGNHAEQSATETHSAGPTDRPARPSRIRQSTKPLLNVLETEYERRFLDHEPNLCRQAIRFKLANGLWYKVDFFCPEFNPPLGIEVKGPHAFRGGFENLKMAAHQYHWIKWKLVWKLAGQWQEQEVLP